MRCSASLGLSSTALAKAFSPGIVFLDAIALHVQQSGRPQTVEVVQDTRQSCLGELFLAAEAFCLCRGYRHTEQGINLLVEGLQGEGLEQLVRRPVLLAGFADMVRLLVKSNHHDNRQLFGLRQRPELTAECRSLIPGRRMSRSVGQTRDCSVPARLLPLLQNYGPCRRAGAAIRQ